MEEIGLLLLGLTEGFFSAALGIGGGGILVPSLILIFGYKIKDSIGVSLAVIAAPVTVAIITHFIVNSTNIKLTMALVMIIGAAIGSRIGTKVGQMLDGRLLTVLFAFLLLFMGLQLMSILQFPTYSLVDGTANFWLVLLGLFSGFCSALFGIGGGVVLVPVLTLFFSFSIHEAIPTSLLVILPTVLLGAMFHNKYENIDLKAVRFIIPTALIGAVLGAIVANQLPGEILKFVFGIFMLLVAARILMIQKTIGALLKKSISILHSKI